jgi:hypothetical protein
MLLMLLAVLTVTTNHEAWLAVVATPAGIYFGAQAYRRYMSQSGR